MKKGIFSKLFGRSDLKDGALENLTTIADVEAALSALADERRAAQETISDGARRRNELLLTDDSDADIAALEQAADAHRLTLERADLVEPKLLERLRALRTDARNAQWSKFQKKRDKLGTEFIGAMRGALTAYCKLVAISEEARAAGFEREAVAMFAPPFHVLDEALIDRFEADMERIRDAAAGRGKAAAPAAFAAGTGSGDVPADARAKPAATIPSASIAARPAVAPPPPPQPARRIPKPKPDKDGKIPCVIIRAGFEIEEGVYAAKCGSMVRLPIAQAEQLALRGAIEWATTDESATPVLSVAATGA